MNNTNRFFTLETEARQQFYQVPKAFMCEDSKYFTMNPMSKLLYGILADRNSLSMANGWVDELNRIYFIFNQEELCKLMGIKHPMTLRKYLKELEQNGLLYRKRMGLNKADRLYLLQVETPQTLINSLMDKNYLSGQIKISYQDRQNLSTNYTEKNNTEFINSSSSKDKPFDEEEKKQKQSNSVKKQKQTDPVREEKIKKILAHCQKCNFRLQKRTIEKLVDSYKEDAIMQAITTATNVSDDIKKPASYLMAVLNDMSKNKTVTINKEIKDTKKQNSFNNFTQRKYSEEQMAEIEQRLLDLSFEEYKCTPRN